MELSTAQFSSLHTDIIEAHILTRLDGPTLAAAACASTALRRLSSQDHLWAQACGATWPSTASPRLAELISTFPNGGPRDFYAQSFPLPVLDPAPHRSRSLPPHPAVELISAVDIRLKGEMLFSKVKETETETGWFRCSPFRIDLLELKDVVPTPIKGEDDSCVALLGDMTLSWILVDPTRRRAVNLSSHRPVSVERHWLSGEVQVRFSSVLAGAGKRSGNVQCGIVVTCGRSERGEMQLREVTMEAEDMDGVHLNGKDTVVILERALEGKKGNAWDREGEGKRRYKEYLEMKQRRKERKLRTEGTLDTVCVAFGMCIFVAFWGFLWCKL